MWQPSFYSRLNNICKTLRFALILATFESLRLTWLLRLDGAGHLEPEAGVRDGGEAVVQQPLGAGRDVPHGDQDLDKEDYKT